jgi:hypothetical protein
MTHSRTNFQRQAHYFVPDIPYDPNFARSDHERDEHDSGELDPVRPAIYPSGLSIDGGGSLNQRGPSAVM